jgi:hypothetical protein
MCWILFHRFSQQFYDRSYNVHDKLVNFAAPQPRAPVDWDVDMLYDSLFQESQDSQKQARELALENDNSENDLDDDQDNEDEE